MAKSLLQSQDSFIHSFIMEIYTALLQGYYSEALPTFVQSCADKRNSFQARDRCRLIMGYVIYL